MRSQIWLSIVITGSVACTSSADDGVTMGTHDYTVIERFDRAFRFESPTPSDVYVEYRALSYPAHVAEYGLRIGDRELVAVYSIAPAELLPLYAEVFDRATLEPLVTARSNDMRLEVSDASDVVLVVDDYLSPSSPGIAVQSRALDPDALATLESVLPARGELGVVPQFFLNRGDVTPVPGTDGVSQTTSDPRPLVDWSAAVSLLGAYAYEGVCVQGAQAPDYACPCFAFVPPDGHEIVGTCP
jgi:hypothetical protein